MNSISVVVFAVVAFVIVEGQQSRLAQAPFARPRTNRQQQFIPQPFAVFRVPQQVPPTSGNVVPIVSQSDVRDDKGYSYSYETGDRTVVSERGLYRPGPEGNYIVAEGSFSYVAPDGTQYTITYKADENGFQPQGDHIPKA